MFNKMFMMNMLLKIIIYAKVCITYIFKPKRYQKFSRVSLSNQHQSLMMVMMMNIRE